MFWNIYKDGITNNKITPSKARLKAKSSAAISPSTLPLHGHKSKLNRRQHAE